MNWAFPKKGDRRLVAEWLISIGGDPVNGVDPDKCKYGHAIQYDTDLTSAIEFANSKDLNNEGTVSEEEYTGETWTAVQRYNCIGESMWEESQ